MASVEERLTTLERDVGQLTAKDALRRVLSRYAVGVDTKRSAILRELFDEEALVALRFLP